jgi:hypothetical protein
MSGAPSPTPRIYRCATVARNRLVRRKCDRARRYKVARLIAEQGADMKLPELRHVLAKCPRINFHKF